MSRANRLKAEQHDATQDEPESAAQHPQHAEHIDDGKHLSQKSATSLASAPEAAASQSTVLPLSMKLLRYAGGGGCCAAHCNGFCQSVIDEKEIDENVVLGNFSCTSLIKSLPPGVSPLVVEPMMSPSSYSSADFQLRQRQQQPVLERILLDYKAACQLYECATGPNPGVLTTFRYQLPSLRTIPPFQDSDMLALAEVLLKYGNGPLKFIRRLDFSKSNKVRGGMGSHGALALAKVLQTSLAHHVTHVDLQRNWIGPYGATAIFLAIANSGSSALEHLSMRQCRIGQRGALALAAYIVPSTTTKLTWIDVSTNHCGYQGCVAIARAFQERNQNGLLPTMTIDLDGNHVFQEIMNSVTHGLGVLLAFIGAYIMSSSVQGKSAWHTASCGIYSTSLVVLYTSSTLFHSFFVLRYTQWIFRIVDKCAIYILIAGSYTPFIAIVLHHEPFYSTGLLVFLWSCSILGIGVEFARPKWEHRGKFSLAMYLGMGWSAIVCLPKVTRILPRRALEWMVLGGVSYTAGVPFFVRNNS